MSAQRVILVTASRLLGELLRTVIERSEHLQIVREVRGDQAVRPVIEQTEAEWMILSPASNKTVPGWVDQYLSKHPATVCLTILTGKNKVRLKWLDHEEDLEDLTLQELLHMLEAHPQHV